MIATGTFAIGSSGPPLISIATLLVILFVGGAGTVRADAQSDLFLAKIEAGQVAGCPFCDLKGKNFAGKSLVNANLQGADLAGADLSGAVLDGAMLARADLSDADLKGASMKATSLGPTDLTAANLTNAQLEGAVFGGTDFTYAVLTCTGFASTDAGTAIFGPSPRFGSDEARGCRTSFRYAALSCEFPGNWTDLDLDGALLPRCENAPSPPRVEVQPAPDAAQQPPPVITITRPLQDGAVNCGGADLSGLKQTVFVSPDGVDGATCGSQESGPCKTISKGIAQCHGAGCGVLVGYGVYTPAKTIDVSQGLRVIGGCLFNSVLSQEMATTQYYALVNAPAGGAAAFTLSATQTSTQQPALFGAKVMGSRGASTPGSGTRALTVQGDSVSLATSRVYAGAATVGAKGTGGGAAANGGSGKGRDAGTNGTCVGIDGGEGAVKMKVTIKAPAFKEGSCTPHCSENTCYGYIGSGANPGGGGKYGDQKCYSCPAGKGSFKGTGRSGTKGGNGMCGIGGGASHDTAGSFQDGTWRPARGGTGVPGLSGSGGGGGGSGGYCGYVGCFGSKDEYPGLEGAGGGAGGCGGAPGAGGLQGGFSVAVMMQGAVGALHDVTIIGGRGGDGGPGGAGGTGGLPGKPGSPPGSVHICEKSGGRGGAGGYGGFGGSGGGGAGGNGGPAIGIAVLSGKIDGAPIYYMGTAGTGGVGGSGGQDLKKDSLTYKCVDGWLAGAGGAPGLAADSHRY